MTRRAERLLLTLAHNAELSAEEIADGDVLQAPLKADLIDAAAWCRRLVEVSREQRGTNLEEKAERLP